MYLYIGPRVIDLLITLDQSDASALSVIKRSDTEVTLRPNMAASVQKKAKQSFAQKYIANLH